MDHVRLTDPFSAPLLRSHSLLLSCKYCRPQPRLSFFLSSSLDCDEGRDVSPGLMNENTSHTAGTETGRTCYCFRWVVAYGPVWSGDDWTYQLSFCLEEVLLNTCNDIQFFFFFFFFFISPTHSNVEMLCWMWIVLCLALNVRKCTFFFSSILVKVQWVTAIKHCALWSFGPYTQCLKNALYGVLWWKVTGFKIPSGVINVVPRGGRPDRVQYISSHIAHTKNT